MAEWFLVEAPGTAPGSEWFITQVIYRHSRQADTCNIAIESLNLKPSRAGGKLFGVWLGPDWKLFGQFLLIFAKYTDIQIYRYTEILPKLLSFNVNLSRNGAQGGARELRRFESFNKTNGLILNQHLKYCCI